MTDFFIVAGMVVALMPLFYLISNTAPSGWSFLVVAAILYPTLAALINGAPFVPTPMGAVEKMIKAAKLKKGDKVYDIGCGDGRIVHHASRDHEVNATGFELSPFVFLLARVRKIFWKSKARIVFGDFKKHDFSDADVIFCYLLPDTLAKLESKLSHELKKGARVISYAFPISPWKEERKVERDSQQNLAPVWVYVK